MAEPMAWTPGDADLRRALEEERARTQGFTFPAELGDRIVQNATSGLLPSTGAGSVAIFAGAALGLVVGVLVAGVWFATRNQPAPVAPEVVAAASEVAPPLSNAPRAAPTGPQTDATGATTAPKPSGKTSPARRVRAASEAKKQRAGGARKGATRLSSADVTRIFERAESAARERRHKIAAEEYAAYLQKAPRGSLVAEARLGLLEHALRAESVRLAKKALRGLSIADYAPPQRRALRAMKASWAALEGRCADAACPECGRSYWARYIEARCPSD